MKPKTLGRSGLALVLLGLLCPRPAAAQERRAPAIDVAAGTLVFPDDGSVSEGFVGGNARFYLTPRLAVGPEVAFISGDTADHLMLTGNVTLDFVGPVNGRPPRVTPFVVAGAGLFRTSEEFASGTFTHNEGAFTAGGGVRVLVADRVSVGGEVRVGWELHTRFNGFVSIRLGR
jgi:outer membrane protein with beta-barrel domain